MIELKELTLKDDRETFNMIKEIGPGENGFVNSGYDMSYDQYSEYLQRNFDNSRGINLKPEYVPQTIYWLYAHNRPVGFGKLRDYLNDSLKINGGHIGYTIRPSERGKGYGNLILRELLEKAKNKGIEKVLLTIDENNIPSCKMAKFNDFKLDSVVNGKCYYWRELQING